MKNYLYSLLCIALLSCGQTQNPKEKPSLVTNPVEDSVAVIVNPSTVEDIKKVYTATNEKLKSQSLDSVSYMYNCNDEISGTVTYYSESGKLKLIKHSYSEYSHFTAVDHYYVSDDNLFFAHLKGVSWSFESGRAAEGATKDNITEQRLYVVKKLPVLCLEKKYIKRSHAQDNPLPENVPNKEVECKSIEPTLRDFGKLLAFKDSSNRDCLGK